MKDIEKRARELLAAEVDRDAVAMPGVEEVATSIRNGGHGSVQFVPTALRAIIAALTPSGTCALAAARAALPFIAYAFYQRVDGAEQAGRAIEAALQTNEPEGYVLVPAELLRMVVGCAYQVSSEIDPRGYSWSEAYLDEVLPQIKAALLSARPEVSGG